ncbi:MAG: mevalonate kinase [Candidatus Altiarchaeota archaeon]|nr:mevalonate kinase [Candidatus Altiarchaeota archaeon]
MGEGHGYGKTILFGEHFVVYGLPAIASALGSKTTCIVEPIEGGSYELIDERPATPGYKKEKFDEQKASIENVFQAAGLSTSKNPVKIIFAGDLKAASGVGASAASCAALARALNDEFKLGFDDARINEIAYEGEKGYHGTPSGIDNTAAVYGGLIWFVKNLSGGKNTMELLKLKKPVEVVIGNTGLTSSTKEVVGDVKKLKESRPQEFDAITREYNELAVNAKDALLAYDTPKVGELMNQCHRLLQRITVSCVELDLLVDAARSAGALGAKLTGTGRGGLMIALTPGLEVQAKVAKAIEDEGYSAIRTKIG